MLGKEELKKSEHELRGLMPRAAEEVFRAAQEGSSQSPVRFSFFVSFLEIYLEQVKSPAEVLEVLRDGTSFRSTASTAQNDVSSRSHTIFTLSVVQRRDGQRPITGRLHLVDLAGSERLTKSHSEGQRLTEAKAINKSLTALGKVVTALLQESSEGSKPHHVPFRDTKLTRLLKDSLQAGALGL
ncbi:kinesin-like protein [Haematococcus lacustris]|uniref:Kinesin-like protein n=1 Tax=Haematococcus lacustris TaxID=44745 RepID=A0A699Z623_HAELA|nr:kinesin-like protein [Haematococcus lacustris]